MGVSVNRQAQNLIQLAQKVCVDSKVQWSTVNNTMFATKMVQQITRIKFYLLEMKTGKNRTHKRFWDKKPTQKRDFLPQLSYFHPASYKLVVFH